MAEVMSLKEAAKLVKNGDKVCFTGFSLTRNSVAFTHELIRQRKRNLTIASIGFLDADLLHGAGCAMSGGGGSMDRFGPCYRVQDWSKKNHEQAISGSILTEDLRWLAAAMGLPFIASTSLLGTDVIKTLTRVKPKEYREGRCPFSDRPVVLLRPKSSDVAVVHAQQADTQGNIRMYGPLYSSLFQARSARKLIVTVEEIYSPEITKREPERTVLPGYFVDAVVWAPFGAHPTSLWRCYDYDAEHLMLYQEHAKTQEGFDKYLEEWVLGVDDWFDYLQKVGLRKLLQLKTHNSYCGSLLK